MTAITSWMRSLAVPGPPPGPCEARAAPAGSKAAATAAPIRDIRGVKRDGVMTISCEGRFQKIRTTGYAGFEECLVKMLSLAAGTGARDTHSYMWRSYSHPIHVAHSSFTICVAAKRPIGSGARP